LRAIRRLKHLEYRIALDDFVFRPELADFLPLADYIKLDYQALGASGFREQMQILKPYTATILAEKIESEAEFRWCKAEGCSLLRLFNSALYRRRSEIRSPAQAVTLLGMDFVVRWATLLSMAGNDDCPPGYLEAALQRARTCELIAGAFGSSASEAYVTGLLS